MIAAILTLLALLFDAPCHCTLAVTERGYRCSFVRARSLCPVDQRGWHVVAMGVSVCSFDCGPDGHDDTN